MNRLLKPLQWIYSIYAFFIFIVLMLLVFPFVLLATFFGRVRGGNMVYHICMFWGDIWFPLICIWPKRVYETPHDTSKPYIFVSNHTSYLDAAVIVKAFRQPVRPLGKVEMSKVPVFGFIYKNAIVAVDRSNPENRAKSVSILKSIIRKGISILMFPEGTFNMTAKPLKEFYDGAFRVAIETQTPIKPVLFPDNFSRLHYRHILSLTPGRCRIIYLDEIPVSGYRLRDAGKLKEEVFEIMGKKLIEYGVAWIK
jgi:1-acyl-sn-glycerol-3-phosphate acyltransferase